MMERNTNDRWAEEQQRFRSLGKIENNKDNSAAGNNQGSSSSLFRGRDDESGDNGSAWAVTTNQGTTSGTGSTVSLPVSPSDNGDNNSNTNSMKGAAQIQPLPPHPPVEPIPMKQAQQQIQDQANATAGALPVPATQQQKKQVALQGQPIAGEKIKDQQEAPAHNQQGGAAMKDTLDQVNQSKNSNGPDDLPQGANIGDLVLLPPNLPLVGSENDNGQPSNKDAGSTLPAAKIAQQQNLAAPTVPQNTGSSLMPSTSSWPTTSGTKSPSATAPKTPTTPVPTAPTATITSPAPVKPQAPTPGGTSGGREGPPTAGDGTAHGPPTSQHSAPTDVPPTSPTYKPHSSGNGHQPQQSPSTGPAPSSCDWWCQLQANMRAHPLSWLVVILAAYGLLAIRRQRRRRADEASRGEYRQVAARFADSAFGDDYSPAELEADYVSEDEEGWVNNSNNGSIQMSSFGGSNNYTGDEDGLSLDETNG